ncbi:RHS repeat-associated core domain-containing protein [Pseudomonas sp. NBRC 111124]|uniref:RHS repeat-associated core domain-containing protein n=1 Tax=Pseudomonas sp. NBRC 111124 TaxID=1661039 RepID=UPI0009E9CC8B
MKQRQSRLASSQVYTPYGFVHAQTASPMLAFNGQRKDPVTDSYPLGNGYRIYSPFLMRFHSPDRLSPFGAGGNISYAYCENDPLNHVDPSGQVKFLVRSGSRYQTKFSLPTRSQNSTFALPKQLRSAQKAYQKLSNKPLLAEQLATDQLHAKQDLKFSRRRVDRMFLALEEIDARLEFGLLIEKKPQDAPLLSQTSISHQSPTIRGLQPSRDVNIQPEQNAWLRDFRTAIRNGSGSEIARLARERLGM